MNSFVVITFQLEGFHSWPRAPYVFPDVAFLADRHRHMFHFKLVKQVHHDDRDVEFIRWKREVVQWLQHQYGEFGKAPLQFGTMSCEQIAKELLQKYDCTSVEVWEDGENGAIVNI